MHVIGYCNVICRIDIASALRIPRNSRSYQIKHTFERTRTVHLFNKNLTFIPEIYSLTHHQKSVLTPHRVSSIHSEVQFVWRHNFDPITIGIQNECATFEAALIGFLHECHIVAFQLFAEAIHIGHGDANVNGSGRCRKFAGQIAVPKTNGKRGNILRNFRKKEENRRTLTASVQPCPRVTDPTMRALWRLLGCHPYLRSPENTWLTCPMASHTAASFPGRPCRMVTTRADLAHETLCVERNILSLAA